MIKLYVKTFLLICLIAGAFCSDGMAQFAKCQGKNIVDKNGQVLLLRGIGLGGWLVPEGYMLHIPGFGSPKSIHDLIQNLIGEANTEQFYQLYRANYVAEKDIRQIAEWGFNSIRLPFNYRMLSPEDQPGVYLEEGFVVIDSLIAWCKRYNLYVILDMHCAPGGQNAGNISDSDGTARLWTERANQDRTVDIWLKIAQRYANEEWILGYDLLNETVLPSGHSNLELRNLYLRLCQTIRQVDNNHIIFLEGSDWGNNFESLTPPILFGTNIAYSFHKYWNPTTLASIQSFISMRNSFSVPLWLGEFGENSNSWFYDTVKLIEDNSIGWCFWTHKKLDTITSPFNSPIASAYQTVLDYWNGRVGRPSEAFARNALFEMAQNLALEKCEFHPDVLAALMDKNSAAVPKAYREHKLPGIVQCAEYNIGQYNLAYYDKGLVRRDDYGQSEDWNAGWKYRNDGVDIGKSSAGGYYVGWTQSGEWLKYTVQVDVAGTYEVSFSVASPKTSGIFKLSLDGREITQPIAVPNTGGWDAWRTIKAENVQLSGGQHELTLVISGGDFNIQKMEFVLKTASGTDNDGEIAPEDFRLGQNYPNPFNGETIIPVSLPEDTATQVRLSIHNLFGEEVKVLTNGRISGGQHEITWDGMDDNNRSVAGGVYFYRAATSKKARIRKLLLLR